MSRSYKKTPGWVDRNPYAKRAANKRVRRYKHWLPDGRTYRKVYCSWEIRDYRVLLFMARRLRHWCPNADTVWRARMK